MCTVMIIAILEIIYSEIIFDCPKLLIFASEIITSDIIGPVHRFNILHMKKDCRLNPNKNLNKTSTKNNETDYVTM